MDFATLKSIHYIAVSIYVLFFTAKVYMVLTNKKDQLAVFKKKTLILEISLPIIFITTGVIALSDSPIYSKEPMWFHIKMTLLVIGIATGIIGIKKFSKPLVLVSIFSFLAMYGYTEMMGAKVRKSITVENESQNESDIKSAKAIFSGNCINCHKGNEEKNVANAPVLSESTLTKEEIIQKIQKGGNGMTAYETILKAQEIISLADYVDSLRNNQ